MIFTDFLSFPNLIFTSSHALCHLIACQIGESREILKVSSQSMPTSHVQTIVTLYVSSSHSTFRVTFEP